MSKFLVAVSLLFAALSAVACNRTEGDGAGAQSVPGPSGPSQSHRVRIVDDAGLPVAGAILDADAMGEQTYADADGWVTIGSVDAHRETVSIWRYGFAEKEIPLSELLADAEFALNPLPVRAMLLVRFIDSDSQLPLQQIPAAFSARYPRWSAHVVSTLATETQEGLARVPIHGDDGLLRIEMRDKRYILDKPSREYRISKFADGEIRTIEVPVRRLVNLSFEGIASSGVPLGKVYPIITPDWDAMRDVPAATRGRAYMWSGYPRTLMNSGRPDFSDIPPGAYRAILLCESQPPSVTPFTIQRNGETKSVACRIPLKRKIHLQFVHGETREGIEDALVIGASLSLSEVVLVQMLLARLDEQELRCLYRTGSFSRAMSAAIHGRAVELGVGLTGTEGRVELLVPDEAAITVTVLSARYGLTHLMLNGTSTEAVPLHRRKVATGQVVGIGRHDPLTDFVCVVEDVLHGSHLTTTGVSFGYYVPIDESGNFTICNLPAGPYRLSYVGDYLRTSKLGRLAQVSLTVPAGGNSCPHVELSVRHPEEE